MKAKILLTAFLLLFATLFSACSNVTVPQSNLPDITENTTEPPAPIPDDPFREVRESKERWLAYGLLAYESGKQVENLKPFFANEPNMMYLTLYDHMFVFDKDLSVPVAEALFAFIYNQYGATALMDTDRRCEYKTAYLNSLGLETEYPQLPQVEKFLASMRCTSNAAYQYIISVDNVTYYFKDFNVGSPSQYHGFLYYSTTGLFEMIDYLKTNCLSDRLNTDRKFNYYMTFDGSGYSKTLYGSGNMYINESYSTLHEAVHAMGITKNDHIWLSEGICNYFGRALGFNEQIAGAYIQILNMVKQGYFDEAAAQGDQQSILYKRIYEDYISRGGTLDSIDTFQFRLYFDVIAKTELDTGIYRTLGEAYQIVNKTECNAIGAELSYDQTTSLIFYLVNTYGIESILEAYDTQNIEAIFGKDFESLKEDWINYLNC